MHYRITSKGFNHQTHCTDYRTHAYCIPPLHVLDVFPRFNWEVLSVEEHWLHRPHGIGPLFWRYHTKVCNDAPLFWQWMLTDSVWEACSSPVPACVERVPMQRFNHQELLGPHRPYSPLLPDVEEDDIEHMLWHLPCVDMSWWCAWFITMAESQLLKLRWRRIHCIGSSVSLQWRWVLMRCWVMISPSTPSQGWWSPQWWSIQILCSVKEHWLHRPHGVRPLFWCYHTKVCNDAPLFWQWMLTDDHC